MPPITLGVFFVFQTAFPGSTRSGEKHRKKSFPACRPVRSSVVRRTSLVVPGYLFDSIPTSCPGRNAAAPPSDASITNQATVSWVVGSGLVLTTILGTAVGVARLSSNWLVSRLATLYVETIRNTPLLVKVIFWYFAVFLQLPRIEDAVRLAMQLSSLGRAARSKAQIKVRQPLAEALVVLPSASEGESLLRIADQLREELNVKDVACVDDAAALGDYELRPRLAVLGPKYGAEVQKVGAAVGRADPRSLAPRVRSGASVEVDGYTLEADEIEVKSDPAGRYPATINIDFFVDAVDDEITYEASSLTAPVPTT